VLIVPLELAVNGMQPRSMAKTTLNIEQTTRSSTGHLGGQPKKRLFSDGH